IGADGLIRARSFDSGEERSKPYEIVAAMELFNADGKRAEMSGNGIRCLGHALWDAGIASGNEILIATDAGVRKLELKDSMDGGVAIVSVDMGTVVVGEELSRGELNWISDDDLGYLLRVVRVNAGNPHLVAESSSLDVSLVERIGLAGQSAIAGGVNVELFRPIQGGAGGCEMVVFERGVGMTQACGTGTCAVAAAARVWGIAGDFVDIENPGGRLRVTFCEETAILEGEVVKVGEILVDDTWLALVDSPQLWPA
ncbi:MAG TPA: diaminopimelate epimerase, partial [Acidimicrobiales bacterium]|nr:diaminopimelate epimerase [Acidimicrobiales bacterium]